MGLARIDLEHRKPVRWKSGVPTSTLIFVMLTRKTDKLVSAAIFQPSEDWVLSSFKSEHGREKQAPMNHCKKSKNSLLTHWCNLHRRNYGKSRFCIFCMYCPYFYTCICTRQMFHRILRSSCHSHILQGEGKAYFWMTVIIHLTRQTSQLMTYSLSTTDLYPS